MPGNLSWLSGLGAGLSNLGQNLNTQALLDKEMQRQKALDALNQLVTLRNVGGTQLPSGVNPMQAQQGALVSDLGNAPGLTATAAGMPTFGPAANAVNTNPANPLAFGNPRTVQLPGPDGQPINILMDPSKTPEALGEQRMFKQQDLMTQRAQAVEAQRAKAAADLRTQETQAAQQAAQNKQHGDYQTLKAEYGKDPLAAMPFDPNTDYTSALANARATGLQEKALAAQAQGDWAPTGAVDATTQEPILFNKKTGQTRVMAGAMKPAGGAGGGGAVGGLGAQVMARMNMSYRDLQAAADQMTKFENDPAQRAKLTAGTQALGAGAEMQPDVEARGLGSGLGSMAASYLGAKAQQQLGSTDPDYRTYLQNRAKVATALTEILPRPNQQLLGIEKGLSGIDVGWNPQYITNVQARRAQALQSLGTVLQHMGVLDANGNEIRAGGGRGSGAGGSAPPAVGKTTLSPTAYQALRAKGYTDAQIGERYVIPHE